MNDTGPAKDGKHTTEWKAFLLGAAGLAATIVPTIMGTLDKDGAAYMVLSIVLLVLGYFGKRGYVKGAKIKADAITAAAKETAARVDPS